MYAALF